MISKRSAFSKSKFALVLSLADLFVQCCRPSDNLNEVFDFDLTDQIAIQGTSDTLDIAKAYLDTEFQWTSTHVNLNDGVVGDSLVTSCGNWNFEINPTSMVEIWFPDAFVEDGVYHFSGVASSNDFQILIKQDLSFGPTFISGYQVTENSIQNEEIVARGFTLSNSGQPYDVAHASVQIENIRSQESSIRFVLELANEECIQGSFQGVFEPFSRIEVEGDCD